MVLCRSWSAWPNRRRLSIAVAVLAVSAACSPDVTAPADREPTVAAAPSANVVDPPVAEMFEQPATEVRPIIAGSGEYPVSRSPSLSPPSRVGQVSNTPIGGGRIWVPWPPYLDPGVHSPAGVDGSRSALLTDVERGYRHVVAERGRWDDMPPYTPTALTAFAEGTRVARRRAGTESAWELVVDPAGLDHKTSLAADRSAAIDHASVCPAHPTAEVLGVDLGDSPDERNRAGVAIEAFMLGLRSPGGRPMHSWGTTSNDVAKLLAYSPGEPMELALGGHSLTDLGYFPGDWSLHAKQWLTHRAAQGAVTDSLVAHAAVSTGPETLWEACSDLATITPGVYSVSHRTRQLESLWARGLRLDFTTPPVERAWVADLSAAGHALAVVCHQAGRSYLTDASTGERLDAGSDHAAQVEAMWLTWSRLSYRVLRNALFDGACDGAAFEEALQWLHRAQSDHEATIDRSERRSWGSGLGHEWVAIREWVTVDQAEAWRAHRDHDWHLEFWCRIGIPVGALVDGELRRPELAERCTPEQWSALNEAAASAPEATSELSATLWDDGASWHERMYLSPFKSLEQIFGCSPDEAAIAEALQRPPERRVKKPWPPGSLPVTEADRAYPALMPPCPRASWPPHTERFWWPRSAPLAEEAA